MQKKPNSVNATFRRTVSPRIARAVQVQTERDERILHCQAAFLALLGVAAVQAESIERGLTQQRRKNAT